MKGMAAVAASAEDARRRPLRSRQAAPSAQRETAPRRARCRTDAAPLPSRATATASNRRSIASSSSTACKQQIAAAGADAGLVPVPLLFARPAEDDHQPGDRGDKLPGTSSSAFSSTRCPYLMMLCALFLVAGADQRRLQVLHQHVQGAARRADAAPLPLFSCTCGCCASRRLFPEDLVGPDHPDDHRRDASSSAASSATRSCCRCSRAASC